MQDMARYILRWGNPTVPPPGPHVLIAQLVPRGDPCPKAVMDQWVAGAGYVISWELVTPQPVKRWSKEAKAKVREANLRRRMEKKYPLFAERFIFEELTRRRAYYAGEDREGRT
ncbi:hypothetical protein QCN27_15710 [Cereibacter sp. SYSU M97828]|nr:hypothetical protein [Cereibacter flavus]